MEPFRKNPRNRRPRPCVMCRTDFIPIRSSRLTCSEKCRKALQRLRKSRGEQLTLLDLIDTQQGG